MDEYHDIWHFRREAKWRLSRATEIGDCNRFDLLGAKARRPIVKSLAAPSVARDVFGMRQASMQNRWRLLVELAADKPLALGFVQVYGALRGLGVDLDADYTTLCRNLNAWEAHQPPLVVTGHGERTKARAPMVMIQVPFLTQWLLWTAEARAMAIAVPRGSVNFDRIRRIACDQIPLGLPPPPTSTLTWSEGSRLVGQTRV